MSIEQEIQQLKEKIKLNYEEIDARLQVIEAFYNNIKLITTNKEELE